MNNYHPLIAKTWAERAQAELGAQKKFKEIIKSLNKYKFDLDITSLAVEAYRDEERHAIECARMARYYGHQTGFESISYDDETILTYDLDEHELFILEVVLMGCLTETFNASLLSTLYTKSKKGKAHQLIHRILKDEVKHAQFGWAFLQRCHSKYDLSFISSYLPDLFEMSVQDELFLPSLEGTRENTIDDGVLPFQYRQDQFVETFESVILPGFEQFNIETSDAKEWLLKKNNQSIQGGKDEIFDVNNVGLLSV